VAKCFGGKTYWLQNEPATMPKEPLIVISRFLNLKFKYKKISEVSNQRGVHLEIILTKFKMAEVLMSRYILSHTA
jgi:hypothetical protein